MENSWNAVNQLWNQSHFNLVCEDCFISSATGETKFKTRNTKIYVPLVTLSTQDNAKLLEQLKSDFKRTSNWNKYQTKVSVEGLNQCLDFLTDPSFQGLNNTSSLTVWKWSW